MQVTAVDYRLVISDNSLEEHGTTFVMRPDRTADGVPETVTRTL
jgi:hypothetical protein